MIIAIYSNRICKSCGIQFQGGPRAWYCPECREIRKKEQSAQYRKTPSKRKLGSTDVCENCGEKYIVASGLQKYCEKCSAEMHKKMDAERKLKYYHENKEAINSKRNEARRHPGKRCPICGKDFYNKTSTLYCSEKCRNEASKSNQRLIYDKRRRQKGASKKENNND